MATNAQVGAAFANGREAKGHSLRTENINGVTFAISYRTPVAATDGRVTLKTIDRYSVTTTQQMGDLRSNGRVLPTTERILKDMTSGYMTFAYAVRLGEVAMEKAQARANAKGASVTKVEAGVYSIDGTSHTIRKVRGGIDFWVVYRLTEDGVEMGSPHRTLAEARVAALELADVPAPFINHWAVEHGDFA